MSAFFLFGNYSPEALKDISAERTDGAIEIIQANGGEVTAMYALLGIHDLVLVLDLPGTEAAMKVSIELAKLTGISFTSSPAVAVQEFDHLVAKHTA
ncbi:MAG: GYD domain-containing protein [Gammaproteobacteria bacterium]